MYMTTYRVIEKLPTTYFVLLAYYGNYTFYKHNRQLLIVQITPLLMFVLIG